MFCCSFWIFPLENVTLIDQTLIVEINPPLLDVLYYIIVRIEEPEHTHKGWQGEIQRPVRCSLIRMVDIVAYSR